MSVSVLVGLALLIASGVAIYLLLFRISGKGGESNVDALDTANQILAETDAFRGSRSPGDRPWDGMKRMAPPTQDGGAAGGGGGVG
jgi:hypothetical protein